MKFFIWVLFTGLLACNSQNMTKADNDQLPMFKKTLDSLFAPTVSPSFAYVVLPNAGCGGCISSVSNLLMEYVKDSVPVKFLLTSIASYKAAKKLYGQPIITSPLVYADSTNVFYNSFPQLDQIYPIVFYVDTTGNITRFEYVNPDNPQTVPDLQKYIDSSIRNKRLR